MTEYIKRNDAIHAALHYEGAAAVAAIQGLKAFNPHDIMREMLIDAQIDREAEYERGKQDAVVHGEWEHKPNTYICECTACRKYWIPDGDQYEYNYCPNCGAKMDGR